MARYRVYINVSGDAVYDVEAESPREAEKIAMNIIDIPDEWEEWNIETTGIQQL